MARAKKYRGRNFENAWTWFVRASKQAADAVSPCAAGSLGRSSAARYTHVSALTKVRIPITPSLGSDIEDVVHGTERINAALLDVAR